MSLKQIFAPETNNGTPMESIFSPLEKKPPSDIGMGTVGEVFEKTIFSSPLYFSCNNKLKLCKEGTTYFDDFRPRVCTEFPSSSIP